MVRSKSPCKNGLVPTARTLLGILPCVSILIYCSPAWTSSGWTQRLFADRKSPCDAPQSVFQISKLLRAARLSCPPTLWNRVHHELWIHKNRCPKRIFSRVCTSRWQSRCPHHSETPYPNSSRGIRSCSCGTIDRTTSSGRNEPNNEECVRGNICKRAIESSIIILAPLMDVSRFFGCANTLSRRSRPTFKCQ